jgi:hypothetical protein
MMKKLHSNREFWDQLKENDKVLVKSKDWYDKNAVEENVPIGPKFVSAMTEDCNKFLTVSGVIGWYGREDLHFEIKHNWYTYSSLFVHKLIIRNYRILLW